MEQAGDSSGAVAIDSGLPDIKDLRQKSELENRKRNDYAERSPAYAAAAQLQSWPVRGRALPGVPFQASQAFSFWWTSNNGTCCRC